MSVQHFILTWQALRNAEVGLQSALCNTSVNPWDAASSDCKSFRPNSEISGSLQWSESATDYRSESVNGLYDNPHEPRPAVNASESTWPPSA